MRQGYQVTHHHGNSMLRDVVSGMTHTVSVCRCTGTLNYLSTAAEYTTLLVPQVGQVEVLLSGRSRPPLLTIQNIVGWVCTPQVANALSVLAIKCSVTKCHTTRCV